MTAPAVPAAETVRAARTTVAVDITKSRRRIAELSAQLRAETQQLANLTAMAEIVGVTAVDSESAPDVIDAAVGKAEAPPAVGTPMGP